MIAGWVDTIAARVVIAIVLAFILGVGVEIALTAGLDYFGLVEALSPQGEHPRIAISSTSVLIADPRRNPQMVSARIATVARIAASVPVSERRHLIESITLPGMRLTLRDGAPADPPEDGGGRSDFLRQLIEMQLDLPPRTVRITTAGQPADDPGSEPVDDTDAVLVETPLPDGQLLVVTALRTLPTNWPVLVLRLSPLLVVAGLLSIWTGRRLAAPIRSFAGAAEQLGVDPAAPALPVRGPHELQVAIRAFNRMQERLRRFLEDRTQMLAAMSHDFRAPLARLRWRVEFIEDEEQQRKMLGDLAVMNAMIDSALAFARDNIQQEPRRLVDLAILVEDLCDDMADAGAAVAYDGPRGMDVCCRPSVIRRAVANLVDNAVKYGGSARVTLARAGDRATVAIEDDGPGIPVEQQEKVFAPFHRGDPARDPGKAGVGLGLSIARTAAREHGGDVTLANGASGGLRVCMVLPI